MALSTGGIAPGAPSYGGSSLPATTFGSPSFSFAAPSFSAAQFAPAYAAYLPSQTAFLATPNYSLLSGSKNIASTGAAAQATVSSAIGGFAIGISPIGG